ncbi:MAG: hypothetical protein HONDAALG_01543 [Gammaproteobacteria bacterium]|nr:hypothetical protein [Gammaproteobacteria bacterium]
MVVEELFGFSEGLFWGEVCLEGEGFFEHQGGEGGQALVEGLVVGRFGVGFEEGEVAFLDGFVVEGGEVVLVQFGEDLFQGGWVGLGGVHGKVSYLSSVWFVSPVAVGSVAGGGVLYLCRLLLSRLASRYGR